MTQQQGNHYATLGVTQTASEREIKRAYRERCRECHPDLNPGSEATARMQEVNGAYSVLSSPTRRAEYDRWQQAQAAGLAGTEAPVGAAPEPAEFCCEKCRASDASLRITMFTWVISLLIVSYKRGWAKILCGRCRVKYSLLFNLEVLLFGWWGIPYGPIWSAQALWYNSHGGKQTREHNAALLFAVGYRFFVKGNYLEAEKALAASLKEKHDPKVEALLKETRSMSMMMASAEPSWFENLWKLRLHPAFYNLPLIALVVGIWATAMAGREQGRTFVQGRARPTARSVKLDEQCRLGVELLRKSYNRDSFDQDEVQEQEALDVLRKAAREGHVKAQYELGKYLWIYHWPDTPLSTRDQERRDEALKWLLAAASRGDVFAQYRVGNSYEYGSHGQPVDTGEAIVWYMRAAEQGHAVAMVPLAKMYAEEKGVAQDMAAAAMWWLNAVRCPDCLDLSEYTPRELPEKVAYDELLTCYQQGLGVPKNAATAYMWACVDAILNHPQSRAGSTNVFEFLQALIMEDFKSFTTPEELERGLQQALDFITRKRAQNARSLLSRDAFGVPQLGFDPIGNARPRGSGTGFFITKDGYLVTSAHVIKTALRTTAYRDGREDRLQLVGLDLANDIALLKAEGKFHALPVAEDATVKLGASVLTVGFPNPDLQGKEPKLTDGRVSGLTGMQDAPDYYQISVPVQPGNSGGPLIDQRGFVVGIVEAQLSDRAAILSSGSIPQNVNYALKSERLRQFLARKGMDRRLSSPLWAREKSFDVLAKEAQEAVVLVLVY